MAQHYPIEKLQEQRFRDIERMIRNDVKRSRGLLHTSFRYQYIGIQEDNEVFTIEKTIPKGIVSDNKASFEVHINKNHEVEHIYFVA